MNRRSLIVYAVDVSLKTGPGRSELSAKADEGANQDPEKECNWERYDQY